MTRFSLPARRALAAVPATAVLVVLLPTVASAHVTVNPDTTAAESYASLTFRVPTESESASTEKLVVDLPADTPFLSVTPRALPGWDVEVEVEQLDEPFEVEGATVSEAPARVTWTAEKGHEVPPHEYQEFAVRVGALPEEGTTVVLPAHQTYTDGTVVDWDDLATDDGKEPEAPAPVFMTTAGEPGEGHHGAAASDGAAGAGAEAGAAAGAEAAAADPAVDPAVDPVGRWLGGAGLVLGAVAIGAVLVTRRRA
ncbi:YcnI family protein [Promicromonospora vindobonensis]|uniref:YcnI family protein n=1 Tax=Promicromonospora vindobonensis TaxID=195748 RepID=A0ABW5VR20_9MICO